MGLGPEAQVQFRLLLNKSNAHLASTSDMLMIKRDHLRDIYKSEDLGFITSIHIRVDLTNLVPRGNPRFFPWKYGYVSSLLRQSLGLYNKVHT